MPPGKPSRRVVSVVVLFVAAFILAGSGSTETGVIDPIGGTAGPRTSVLPRTAASPQTSAMPQPPALPRVSGPVRHDTSPAFGTLPVDAARAQGLRELPLLRRPTGRTESTCASCAEAPDPALQESASASSMPPPLASFDGIAQRNGVLPPDTVGDVGPGHYFQWVNLSYAVWDKSGNLLYGPVDGNTMWTGFGGICGSNNNGDPIVLYDELAGRFVISQFALSFPNNFHECIAVSQTADPLGPWHRYDFLISTTKMNDYPKFGVWPDAYYMSINQFDGSSMAWAGGGAVAFERDRMLAGEAARMVYFDLYPVNANLGGMLPSDLDGPVLPPAGTPNFFVEMDDDAWGYSPDQLQIWEFRVDWDDPADSTFTYRTALPTAAFDSNLCGYGRNCIPQPGGVAVDSLSDRLMHRLQYRNFGTHQAMVTNHTVDVNDPANHAGIRWYELRDTGSGWAIRQQGTYAPDAAHRWMGSAAMDGRGDIAVGYSVSSTSISPSIRYAGRLAGDPLGDLSQGETELVAGSGYQTHGSGRWGDYSSLTVDPVDDCTFWFTQEYYASIGTAPWKTRIGSFRMPSCTSAPYGSLEGTVTDNLTGLPIDHAQISTGTADTTTDAAGFYRFASLPESTYSVTASAYGFAPATVTGVSVSVGATTTQDFALTPLPLVTVAGTVTDGSGHGWPLYARIDITSAFRTHTVFTSPATGAYSVKLQPDVPHTFHVEAVTPGYDAEKRSVTPPSTGSTEDFALKSDADDCTAPGYGWSGAVLQNFDGGAFPPADWTVVDNAGTGVVWKTSADWGDPNYTGGSGVSACLNSLAAGSLDYDAELRSPELGTANLAGPYLLFLANYRDNGGADTLDVDISVDNGPWTNALRWTESHGGFFWKSGELAAVDLGPYLAGASTIAFRFHYYNTGGSPDQDWYAQIDDVRFADCVPAAGGLLVGNVDDANTGAKLNGATVWSPAHSDDTTTTFETPDDPAVDDGFYVLFSSLTGSRSFSASAPGGYGTDTDVVDAVAGAVTVHDFHVPAGRLTATPSSLSVTLNPGETATRAVVLDNAGGWSAGVEIREVNAPLPEEDGNGPFAGHTRHLSPKRLNDRDSRGLYEYIPPVARPLAAGDVVQSWDSGLDAPWGIGFDTDATDLWVGNIRSAGGDNFDFRFLTDGTATGDAMDTSPWVDEYAADMAFDPFTRTLWQVNVGGDNCIYEMDPDGMQPTGNCICPPFGTSERGLAFDPLSGTFYAASWNDFVVNHFDQSGDILDSKDVGLAVSGLAYNPATQHLFALTNACVGTDVYVLDTADDYAVLGGFDIAGLGCNEQAGLDLDCNGRLWAVNQATHQVIEAESGETGVCDWDGIPWLSVSPATASVPAGSNQDIDVGFDAEGLTPGTRQGFLRVVHDTPYPVADLGVTLDVPDYNVAVSPATDAASGDSTALVVYAVEISNTGGLADTYDITVTGNLWPTTPSLAVVGPLAKGAEAEIDVKVAVPVDAAAGASDKAVVTATSRGFTQKKASATLTTTSNNRCGVTLTPASSSGSANTGSDAVYDFEVKNTGTVPDTFTVEIDGAAWTTTAATSVGPIAAGASKKLKVTVSVPATAAFRSTDSATVTVTSQCDAAKDASATVETEATAAFTLQLADIRNH